MHLLGARRKDGRGKEAEVEEMREGKHIYVTNGQLCLFNYRFRTIIMFPYQ